MRLFLEQKFWLQLPWREIIFWVPSSDNVVAYIIHLVHCMFSLLCYKYIIHWTLTALFMCISIELIDKDLIDKIGRKFCIACSCCRRTQFYVLIVEDFYDVIWSGADCRCVHPWWSFKQVQLTYRLACCIFDLQHISCIMLVIPAQVWRLMAFAAAQWQFSGVGVLCIDPTFDTADPWSNE